VRTHPGTEGFTLLELLVVSVLIAIMLALTVPRVQGLFFNDPLSRSTRLLVAAIHEARETALDSGQGSVLLVDFSSAGLTIQAGAHPPGQNPASTAEPVAVRLKEPVAFASVWTHSSGRQRGGTTPVRINGRGMIEPAVIELRDADRVMSLKLSPFQPEPEAFDRALEHPAAGRRGPIASR